MKASQTWLKNNPKEYQAGQSRGGYAHLTHYSAEYHIYGDGPPLVLIPGLAGGCGLLGPLARLLAKRFRVITYQLRGEENCFTLRQRFGLDDLVRDLREVLDRFCLEQPTLLGVSFGAVVALEFAARHPSALGNLILQGAGARFEPTLLQEVASTVLARFPLPSDNPFVNQFFNLLFGGRTKPGPLVDFVTRHCWTTDQSIMAHRFQLVQGFDSTDRLGQVEAPTLILAGTKDVLVSSRSANALQAGIADSKLIRMQGAGHLAFVTHAARVVDEVCRFVPALPG